MPREHDRIIPLYLTHREQWALEFLAAIEHRPMADILRERADLTGLLQAAVRAAVLSGQSPDPPWTRIAALGRQTTDEELVSFWATLDTAERDEVLVTLDELTQRFAVCPQVPGPAMRRYMDHAVVALTTEGRPHELLRYAIRAQLWEKYVRGGGPE